jgi:hypothetical protein
MSLFVKPLDRFNEALAMNKLVKFLAKHQPECKFTYEAKHDTCPYDGVILCDGKPYALAEVKGRTGKAKDHPIWHIFCKKVDKIMSCADRDGIWFFLLMVWEGEVYVLSIENVKRWKVELCGRRDRDPKDYWLPCYMIPREDFEKI